MSKIYAGEEYVGSITFNGQRMVMDPANSDALNRLLDNPIYVPIDDDLVNVTAGADPVLFMEYLSTHYKSAQGLRATDAVNLDGDDDE